MSELFRKAKGVSHVFTALEETAGSAVFSCPDLKPMGAMVVVKSSGAVVQWDGTVTLGDGKISMTNDGSTSWAAADTVDIVAW
jgi:hypothetical protein